MMAGQQTARKSHLTAVKICIYMQHDYDLDLGLAL